MSLLGIGSTVMFIKLSFYKERCYEIKNALSQQVLNFPNNSCVNYMTFEFPVILSFILLDWNDLEKLLVIRKFHDLIHTMKV